MENKYDRISQIAYCCFYAGIVIEALLVLIDKSAYINPIEGQMFRLTFLLFMFKVCLTRYTGYEYLAIVLFGIVGGISYFATGRNEVIRLVVMIAACKDINMDKCLKMVFYLTLAGCVMLALLSVLGIYGTVSLAQDYGRGGEETRYTLGLGHPNALHCMLWLVVVLAVYSYADVLKWYWFVGFMAMDFVLYFLTRSKTGAIVWALFILIAFAMKYFKICKENRAVYILGALSVFGCVAFAMVGSHVENTYYTPDSLMHKLDKLLNGRYQSCYAIEAARLENWKLFASPENTVYFDAGFVRLAYWYGIIPAILYVGMNFYLLYQSFRKKDFVLFAMLVTFSIYNLMEAHFISVYILRNYLLVLMGYYWYQPFAQKQMFEGYFWQVKQILSVKRGQKR